MNPYAYAANNPLRYTDPDGRMINTGFSCMLRNPNYARYLSNMSLSSDLQRRQPAPVCTKQAAKGEQNPAAAIEKLLNDPFRIVNVECFDTPMFNTQGGRVWAYTWNQANRIEIYAGGWDPVRAAQTLAHEATHAAL